jgi:hypothetical protein
MAFGLMVNKWGILQRPSRVPLKHIKFMMIAIAKLHNFCINVAVQTDIQKESIFLHSEAVVDSTV